MQIFHCKKNRQTPHANLAWLVFSVTSASFQMVRLVNISLSLLEDFSATQSIQPTLASGSTVLSKKKPLAVFRECSL